MTISYRWLQEYIDLPTDPQEVAVALTSTGLEVESVTPRESVKGGLRGLVIGQVLTCERHPNADKLSLTTVDVGGPAPLKIVCGAPNVAAGQKVVVALTGATLYPSQGEPFTIRNSKIRGEVSEGMLCAEDEIGLGASHAGIMVLDTKLANGTPAAEHFQVTSDYIFEIGLTPNRADAASHIGTARDLKALWKKELRMPPVASFAAGAKTLSIPVVIGTPEECPRYSAVTITGVTVAESPAWLKERLLSIGLTPISNIVDITNFICHEFGQPLHAFDADAIEGNKVTVKTMPSGTKFTTLDGKERELTGQDLMICNEREGMCIAGVFGGQKSGVKNTTKNIFLESACFSPDYVRRTTLHHQLKTDASFRFSRGTDPEITVYALKRAALLIQELAGGTISGEIIDQYPGKKERHTILVKDKNVNRLIGKALPRETVFDILKQLDFTIAIKDEASYTVTVPSYRVEVLQEADVVEEILRIYGFNNIPLQETTSADYLADFPENDPDKFRKTIGLHLAGQGFYEILTNSLTNVAYQEKHKLDLGGKPVEILNKLSEEQGILRQTMLFTGLEALSHNFNRKQKTLRLFEFGKIYHEAEKGYRESERLALYVGGEAEAENWQTKTREARFHDLLQAVAGVLDKTGRTGSRLEPVSDQLFDYSMRIMDGKEALGLVGRVKAALLKEMGIKNSVFYADLDARLLFKGSNPKFDVKEVLRFPEVRRDLSLVLDKAITFDAVRDVVRQTGKNIVRSVNVFDVYEGNNLPEGKKAYALGIHLADETKTLTDEEIDQTMNKLMAEFETKLGAVIRK